MVRTITADGSIERGTAVQRHFVRDVDNDIDGAGVTVSHESGVVTLNVSSIEAAKSVLATVDEYGADVDIHLRGSGGEQTGVYSTGDLAYEVTFEGL